MTDFGDFDEADAYDTAPADPEQVARKIQRLRQELGIESGAWGSLEPAGQRKRIEVARRLLDWLRRQGAT
jgi:hypothetical protein